MADEFVVEELSDRGMSVLKVRARRLEITQRAAFGEACDRLLASTSDRLVVDLSGTDRIFSLFIGAMVDLHVRAERVGKHLSIVAGGPVLESLRTMGLEKTLDLTSDEL